jgi:AraC-like DNA-binding protein
MVIRIKTINQYHQQTGLPKPEHPLVSVVRFEDIGGPAGDEPLNVLIDFYAIALKRNFHGKIKYGQQEYDFDEGIMTFIGPGQMFRIEVDKDRPLRHTGWMLLVHPDFLWNTPMAKTIRQYTFFDYAVNEALFLSDKEEAAMVGILQNIEQEYRSNIDRFSQPIILAQLELLLTYADRFYQRQFLTRKITNHKVIDRLEALLSAYFNSDTLTESGLPTVQYVAARLNISPGYLASLLKTLTGLNTQQHIHEKLIEKAKEKLSTTDLTVSEIAYELGFAHSQSFSKLFKAKTNQSPQAFRQSFE